ncbi:MAG: hypothetical protein HN416_14945 [Nitrospina sp.]|jgi:DNA excision repair protein ERCC-4|nr:hypothetical protein [Nitrospina sp.]
MKLKPENLTVLVDTREQNPFSLEPMKIKKTGLITGDYTLEGLEEIVLVERKELSDLVGCITSGRERFERELLRMKAYPSKCVVVEGGWSELESGSYRSRVNPKAVTHTIASWISRYGVPFQFCGCRQYAQEFTQYFLFTSAKRVHGYLENSFSEILRQAS